jgi:hypothetical protein
VSDAVVHFPSWFPGAGFKREAESWARSMNAIVEVPFSAAKKAMVIRIGLNLSLYELH